MTRPDYSPLFEPLQVGAMTLRNRFAMPAMQIGYTRDCGPTPQMVEHLRQRARGGVGLIFSESCAPDHPSAYWQQGFAAINPATRGAWAEVIDAVKGEGAGFLMQLWHPGAMRKPVEGFVHAETPTLSPSGLAQAGRENGRAMTAPELDDIAAAFVKAAEDAKAIGADGVELHAAHGYLFDQFLWSETNRRADSFGGDALEDRVRFPLAIAAEIRSRCGPDFVISIRFSQFKEVDYGAKVFATPDELGRFVQLAQVAGLSMLNVSSRRFTKPEWPELEPQLNIAGWAKRLGNLPVMTIGSVGLSSDIFADLFDKEDPSLQIGADLAELARRRAAGEFDIAGIGRMLIANPDLVSKVAAGEVDRLELFSKAVHLRHLMGSMEPGLVEEGRKIEEV